MAKPSERPIQLLPYFLFHRRKARALIVLLSLLGACFGVASPFFQKIFVDRLSGAEVPAMRGMNVPDFSVVTAIGLAFVCTLLAQAIALIVNYLCTREGTILQKRLSEDLYRKMLSIRTDSMGSTTVGEVVSLYATDVPGSTALIDQVLPMATTIFFNILIAPIAIIWICDIPLWATYLVIGIIVAMIFTLASRQSQFFARFKQLAAERTGLVNEWVQTIRMLRILGWIESFERKIFTKRREETTNRVAMVTNGQLMNSFGSSINYVLNLTGVASLVMLSERVGGRATTPGELFAMLWIFGVFLVRPFRQLPWFFTFSLDSMTSIRRLEKFLARPSTAGGADFPLMRELNGKIQHGEGEELWIEGLQLEINGQKILEDIDFKVEAGEFIAIVGEVGSGKSMLALSLVGETGARFRKLSVGGKDLLKLTLPMRRRFFSFVPQEGFVMSATLRENIAFEYEPPGDEDPDILSSLTVAQFRLDDEVSGGGGLATEIGERGVNLSGGQRQRVSLARAHHFHRPVILLDDCLSAVDVDTERLLVRDLLSGAWRNSTRLLVTHRLSVLALVDRVFFMEGGRIVEQGPFKDLLERSERVREFVASVKRGEQGSPTSAAIGSGPEEVQVFEENGETGDGSDKVEPIS